MELPKQPTRYEDSEGMRKTKEYYQEEIDKGYTWRTN